MRYVCKINVKLRICFKHAYCNVIWESAVCKRNQCASILQDGNLSCNFALFFSMHVSVCFGDYGNTGCWLLQDCTSKAHSSTSWILNGPEVKHLSLQNDWKAAKLHNFKNCKFACKLRNWGTQQYLTQILFLLPLHDPHGISTGSTFTVSCRWYGNNPFWVNSQ